MGRREISLGSFAVTKLPWIEGCLNRDHLRELFRNTIQILGFEPERHQPPDEKESKCQEQLFRR